MVNINSNYISGETAKELDQLCKDYSTIKTQYEEAKADFEALTKRIKELCTQKDNETAKYFVKMRIVADSTTLDTDRIKKEYPAIAEACQKVKKGYTSIQEILKK